VIDELGLADHGLRYLDVDPSQTNVWWDGSRVGDAPRRRRHDRLDRRSHPHEVDGYRRYLKAAMPAVRWCSMQANDPPVVRRPHAQGARPQGRRA
jgi:phytoene dehydrogenase-like protein